MGRHSTPKTRMFLLFDMERKRGNASNTKDGVSFVFDAFRCAEHPKHAHKGVFRVFVTKRKGRGRAEHQNTPCGCLRVFETKGKYQTLRTCHIGHVFGVWRMEETTEEAEHLKLAHVGGIGRDVYR